MVRGGLDDTICAVATPIGEGGIGIVRLSGSQALTVASRFVRLRSGAPLSSVATHKLYLADLLTPASEQTSISPVDRSLSSSGALLDEALIVYMKAPRSFTAEDVVEIQSHGGAMVLAALCEACIAAGARLAEPGEFTKRAFINGRLDLSQAEAVLDTIRAKSAAGLKAAQRQLRGELGCEVEHSRAALLMVLAHVEAGIDFVEEDISFLQREELLRVVSEVAGTVQRLEATAQQGRILRDGARVVIVGRPNVGKSSLMNRLLREERSIVTAIPGTTRDVIEESINVGGVRVNLADTAGIRQSIDAVEQEGIRRTRSAQTEADLVLIVVDGSVSLTSEDLEIVKSAMERKHLVLTNKSDLPSCVHGNWEALGGRIFPVSAKTGSGIDRVRAAIQSELISSGLEVNEDVTVTNVRHAAALRRAADSLQQALESVRRGMAGEFVSMDVRAAADALGEITGTITTDEILDQIFSEFCIGK